MPKPPKERALHLKTAIDLFSFEKTKAKQYVTCDYVFLPRALVFCSLMKIAGQIGVRFPEGMCGVRQTLF
jgi:hypothetical protein